MRGSKIIFLVLFITLLSFRSVHAITVEEIVEKANLVAYYAGDDGKARVRMTIVDAQGRKRLSEFTILRLDVKEGGEQKFYVYFYKPSDLRKMVYMVEKHIDSDDNRWLYLPALDLVKRIAATDRRSSFVGSHFVYEDISGRGLKEDRHELVSSGEAGYIIKNLPKNPDSVEFSYYTVEIDAKTFMPVKSDYYDKNGELYRRIEALEVKNIQGHPTVTKAKVTDIKTGGHTLIEFINVKYDVGITDRIFSERFLKRPPKKLLRDFR